MKIIKKERKWVIMDKKRKVIAVGVPTNRQLVMLDGESKARILTYNSEKLAINGFIKNHLYNFVSKYFKKTYSNEHSGEWDYYKDYLLYLKAVPVEITIKEIE